MGNCKVAEAGLSEMGQEIAVPHVDGVAHDTGSAQRRMLDDCRVCSRAFCVFPCSTVQ